MPTRIIHVVVLTVRGTVVPHSWVELGKAFLQERMRVINDGQSDSVCGAADWHGLTLYLFMLSFACTSSLFCCERHLQGADLWPAGHTEDEVNGKYGHGQDEKCIDGGVYGVWRRGHDHNVGAEEHEYERESLRPLEDVTVQKPANRAISSVSRQG